MCDSFTNDLERKEHCQNTRNDNLTVKVPKMITDFGRLSFSVTAAHVYNNIPISARKLDSRVLFRTQVHDLI